MDNVAYNNTNLLINAPHLSLQSYFYNDDTFNFNYAQAKAAVGNYKEAEEVWAACVYMYGPPVLTCMGSL